MLFQLVSVGMVAGVVGALVAVAAIGIGVAVVQRKRRRARAARNARYYDFVGERTSLAGAHDEEYL